MDKIGPKVWNGSTSVGAAKGYESPVKAPFRLARRMLGDIPKSAWVRGVFSRGTVSRFTYGVVLIPMWTSDLSVGPSTSPTETEKAVLIRQDLLPVSVPNMLGMLYVSLGAVMLIRNYTRFSGLWVGDRNVLLQYAHHAGNISAMGCRGVLNRPSADGLRLSLFSVAQERPYT